MRAMWVVYVAYARYVCMCVSNVYACNMFNVRYVCMFMSVVYVCMCCTYCMSVHIPSLRVVRVMCDTYFCLKVVYVVRVTVFMYVCMIL